MGEKIGVIGIGKLGLCFALNLAEAGYEVLGIDLDEQYVAQLNNKQIESEEPGLKELLQNSTNFRASNKLSQALQSEIDVLFVLVATPSIEEGGYDHSQIESLAQDLIDKGNREKVVQLIIGCTTIPGYCTISYNPEFIAQGSILKDQLYPDMVLIGEANKSSGDVIESIYKKLCKNEPAFRRMDRLSAEITKLSINCFLTTKISFANSIGDLCEKLGADTELVLKSIGSDSRIGNRYLGYGFGYGGPCLPRDNRALGKFAEDQGYPLLIGKATDKVNQIHQDFQFDWYLKNYSEDEEIYFDYVSYKKESVILEESQQLAIAVRLAKAGRKVKINGQKSVILKLQELHGELFEYGKSESA